MARRRNSSVRQALILAFGAGALAGAAGTLTLRLRRQGGDIPTADAVGHLGDTAFPSPVGRSDGPSPGAVTAPALQQS